MLTLTSIARPSNRPTFGTAPHAPSRQAYTLVEMLIVVTVLGIAGAMVVPAFSGTDSLKVQGAVRTLVADICVAQSDAIAFQRGRGIVFTSGRAESGYVIAEVNRGALDTELDGLETRRIGGPMFGNAFISGLNLSNNQLVFDELGGPVEGPGSDVAAATGWIDITGPTEVFRLTIEAYTGRVTVSRTEQNTGDGEVIIGD